MNDQQMKFKISAALKNIIGKELINDKFIAVFELIKNSYDAGATRVDVVFENFNSEYPQIKIIDNGCGMSYQDLVNKWLFVGYSEKKERNQTDEYREKFKRKAAGAKGVGRFSCDRLGRELVIHTKVETEINAHKLTIDWDRFEEDDKKEFINIDLKYENLRYLNLDAKGTEVVISALREKWNETDLVKLKKSIMKIINPIDEEDDDFSIHFKVTDEDDLDYELKSALAIKNNDNNRNINGKIENDIFEKLGIKTTNIKVKISEDGQNIISRLEDRGSFIYEIKEKNPYPLLNSIKIYLYMLNRSAKTTFTRVMGVEPVNYGSVFVYKNNFRVYPYGEPGGDFFDIDQRKAQGYARYLGTRDLMGRISIKDNDKHFIETSSRNAGFIASKEMDELQEFFIDKALKPLEKYTVDIIKWGELTKEEEKSNTGKVINPEDLNLSVIEKLIINNKNKSNIVDIKYNKELLKTLEIKSKDNLENTIKKIEKVAQLSGGQELLDIAKTLKDQAKELQEENVLAEKEVKNLQSEKKISENQAQVLKSFVSQDKAVFARTLHTIGIDALSITAIVEELFQEYSYLLRNEELRSKLSLIHKIAQKIDFGIKMSNRATFDMGSTKIKTNLGEFIESYYNNISRHTSDITIVVKNNDTDTKIEFDPKEISVLIENIISNSSKAGATIINFDIGIKNDFTEIEIYDNGDGPPNIPNLNKLFELGISNRRNGTGIGLNHIKSIVLEQLNGAIIIDEDYKKGFKLRIRY